MLARRRSFSTHSRGRANNGADVEKSSKVTTIESERNAAGLFSGDFEDEKWEW